MTQQVILQNAVQALQQTTDPASRERELIQRNGGHWNDELAQADYALFEIHLFGVAGVGLGAEAAVQNWLDNATAEIHAPALA